MNTVIGFLVKHTDRAVSKSITEDTHVGHKYRCIPYR